MIQTSGHLQSHMVEPLDTTDPLDVRIPPCFHKVVVILEILQKSLVHLGGIVDNAGCFSNSIYCMQSGIYPYHFPQAGDSSARVRV
jgi:hypothetical protein